MIAQLLTEHHLEFLSIKGGCKGSSESTLVKMPHCWKSHVMAQITLIPRLVLVLREVRGIGMFICGLPFSLTQLALYLFNFTQ